MAIQYPVNDLRTNPNSEYDGCGTFLAKEKHQQGKKRQSNDSSYQCVHITECL